MTRIDIIRKLTAEEMALFLRDIPAGCPKEHLRDRKCFQFEDCTKCWTDWLRQEAKDGKILNQDC